MKHGIAFSDHAMTSDKQRGTKRGVLSTGRAKSLGKTTDADAEADNDDGDEL